MENWVRHHLPVQVVTALIEKVTKHMYKNHNPSFAVDWNWSLQKKRAC